MFIEEKWFNDMNLIDDVNFLMDLIKCAKKYIQRKKIAGHKAMHAVNFNKSGLNTNIAQIFCEKCDGKFLFNENLLIRLPTTVELSHEWIKTNFNYQKP